MGSPSGVTPSVISGGKWHQVEAALLPHPRPQLGTPVRSESLLDPPSLLYPSPILTSALSWGAMGAFSSGTKCLIAGWGFLSLSRSWAGFAGVMELVNP